MSEFRCDVAGYPRPQDPDAWLALEDFVSKQAFEDPDAPPHARTESMILAQRGRCAGLVELSRLLVHASGCRQIRHLAEGTLEGCAELVASPCFTRYPGVLLKRRTVSHVQ